MTESILGENFFVEMVYLPQTYQAIKAWDVGELILNEQRLNREKYRYQHHYCLSLHQSYVHIRSVSRTAQTRKPTHLQQESFVNTNGSFEQ